MFDRIGRMGMVIHIGESHLCHIKTLGLDNIGQPKYNTNNNRVKKHKFKHVLIIKQATHYVIQ